MNNLDLYNKLKAVPNEAKKQIAGGRLKGFTDINPMWRIKSLTEQFGICGIGWRYEIVKQWIESGAGDEKCAFVNINLYIRQNGEWSEAIPGTGGSSFTTKEKNGTYTSDECFKMALTDAISIACKALGMAADVYFQKDATSKYEPRNEPQAKQQAPTEHQLKEDLKLALAATEAAENIEGLTSVWGYYRHLQKVLDFEQAVRNKRAKIEGRV